MPRTPIEQCPRRVLGCLGQLYWDADDGCRRCRLCGRSPDQAPPGLPLVHEARFKVSPRACVEQRCER